MLKLSLSEFFIRGIPEAFVLVFSTYALSKSLINKKHLVISSVLIAILGFVIRDLPINFGVHTVISLFALIVVSTSINKIDIIKSIKASTITIILEFVCEAINVFIIQYVLKLDLNTIFKNPISKTLYGMPSIVLFAFIIVFYYCRLLRRKELQYV